MRRSLGNDLTINALIDDMKVLKERQDKVAHGVIQSNNAIKEKLNELQGSVKSALGRCEAVETALKTGTISVVDKLRIANIVYSAYGYEGAVLANQLDLIYWRETGESFLDDKSNMFDDELVTVTQLGEIYKMRPADVNRTLEANGYITRKEKTGYISLTPLGRACGGRMKSAPNKHFNIHWPKGILNNLRLTRI